ncbi:hypothetical protein PRIPAC_93315, partial [Pristionchus pacificus]
SAGGGGTDLLLAIFKEIRTLKSETNERLEKIEAEMTSVSAFMELAASNREQDDIEIAMIAKSMETQEGVMTQVEKGIQQITETMPHKLAMKYTLITEEEVNELDVMEDTTTIFAGKLADRLFSEAEQAMCVDQRPQHIVNWIIDCVFRRRAYTECARTRKAVASKITNYLNQKATRLRDHLSMVR